MDQSAQDETGSSPSDHWGRLDAFLQTDPRDAGCDTAMEMLDIYAELLAAGTEPAERFPGLHAHFLACGPCNEDLEGLINAIRENSA